MDAINAIAAIPGTFQSARNTIDRSLRNQDKDAQVVANSTEADSHETVEALVDSKQQVLYTQAAARLVSANDAMTKALLDVHA
jgi:hypothetical protein